MGAVLAFRPIDKRGVNKRTVTTGVITRVFD